ncbi:MAG: hypothetical protein JWM77_1258, partial [Rhodospirillales bacterium]|nr:hypothetical protein [Rhodospirillales bacterium]
MSGPRRLSRTVATIAGQALGRKGLGFGQLMAQWDTIVGPDLAGWTRPAKLSFPRGQQGDATLTVETVGARAVELQHQLPQLIERVNSFFGWAAVSRIKLVQAMPAMPPLQSQDLRPLSAEETREVAEVVAHV